MIAGQRIQFKLLGDWALAQRLIKELPQDLKESYRLAQRNYGRQVERRVKAHLRDQDLLWRPLAESTVVRKGSQDILVDTEQYYQAIKTYSSDPYTISVGVKPGIVALKKNGEAVEIAMYAAIHEFGHTFENGRRIPKRALWKPTYDELGGKKGIAIALIDQFNRVSKRKRKNYFFEVKKTVTSPI